MKKNQIITILAIVVVLLLLLFFGWYLSRNKTSADSMPVGQQTARQIAETWLAENPAPMVKHPEGKVWHTKDARPFKDRAGSTIAYIVDLSPEGYVVVPAYEAIDPILAFSTRGSFEGSLDQNDILSDILINDIPGRVKNQSKLDGKDKRQIAEKWGKLKKGATAISVTSAAPTGVITPVVAPLVKTTWNQGNPGGPYTYNYYTPNHYYTGCVATAFAQIIKFFNYPSSASGTNQIHVAGEADYRTVSFNSTYDYTLMPNSIYGSSPLPQIQEIAKLMYDSGIALRMSYGPDGSGANGGNGFITALKSYFKYSSATLKYTSYTDWPIVLQGELNSGYPAALTIRSSANGYVGHQIVADGWGSDGISTYYHLNMGWGGADDGWYSLPKFTAYLVWDQLETFVYNIRKPGTSDPTAPSISITSPVNGQTITGTVNITASASDNVAVTKVEFYRDGKLVDTETNSSGGWYYIWNSALVPNASYTFTAKAYDAAGNVGVSGPVSVTTNNVVIPDTTPPAIQISSPLNGAALGGSKITVSANATDNVGVTKVEFYIDGNLSQTVNASPYKMSWNIRQVASGAHTIQAVAYDAAGNTGASTITVTIASGGGGGKPVKTPR